MAKLMTDKQFKNYRKAAKIIHQQTCPDRGYDDAPKCNYGRKEPKTIQDLPGMKLEECQRRARLRLEWYNHCQESVNAENAAAMLVRKGLLK